MSLEFLPRKVLVVRRDNIGDLVFITPLIDAPRANILGVHIAVLANSYNARVLKGNPPSMLSMSLLS